MARTKEYCEVAALDKAQQLFWQKGFAATSMQELVDVMGISRSSLYADYGNKESLYLKALNSYKEQNAIKNGEDLINAEDPISELKSQLVKTLLLSKNNPNKGCFLVRAKSEESNAVPGLQQIVCQSRDETITFFTQIIRAGLKTKKRILPQQMSTALYALFAGTQLMIANGMPLPDLIRSFENGYDALIKQS